MALVAITEEIPETHRGYGMTKQDMLDRKHNLDQRVISERFDNPNVCTYLDDAIIDDIAPSGDGAEFWNYINNLNL